MLLILGKIRKKNSNNKIGLNWTFDKWANKGMREVFLPVWTEG